ncbi:MAG: aldo/keto reductase [Rhodospirillales bacterium]|jgi:aryl-alcohol dehydrogenase-like predicted oxidoreductase|nr:aldo/keto reductase [Rhodospirillales bacterium]MDP6804195.1 aldo/keto reductase [Rhodospirillales bacterium]
MSAVARIRIAPGYEISRLLKGGWQLSGGHGQIVGERALADMAAFVEAGITTFDCADIYTGVEDLIGAFRSAYPTLAGAVQLHTKFVPDLSALATLDRDGIQRIIDRSLARLQVERLDLVQFHWWDWNVPGHVDAALVLDELRRAGKIRHLGVTNYDVVHLRELLDAGVPVGAHQIQYSLLDARAENGMTALSAERGVPILGYGALGGGFLSQAWLGAPAPAPGLANRSLIKYRLIIDEFGGWARFQALLATLDAIAARHGATIAQVAMRWALDRPGVAGVIVGATSARHLADTVGVFALRLTDEDEREIAAATAGRAGPTGDCFGLERNREGPHGRIMKYELNARPG